MVVDFKFIEVKAENMRENELSVLNIGWGRIERFRNLKDLVAN